MYENLYIADKEGTVLMDSIGGKSLGVEVKKIPFLAPMIKRNQAGKVAVSRVSASPTTGRPFVAVTTPMFDENGTVIGIQGNPVELNSFANGRSVVSNWGETGICSWWTMREPIWRTQKGVYSEGKHLKAGLGKKMLEKKKNWLVYEYNGETWITYFGRYGDQGWTVAAAVPMDEFMGSIYHIRWMSSGIGVLAVLVCVALVWIVTGRGIVKPLKRIIEGLNEASDQVSIGSVQVSSSSQRLAEGASEQAASIEETSASLEEMSSMTKQNADHAREADDLMKASIRVVSEADDSMGRLTSSMEEISKVSEETSKIIKNR